MERRSRLTAASACLLLVLSASGDARADATAAMTESVAIARFAMDRGYGTFCDLAAMPAQSTDRRYYRCVDIGPYRFVEEYAGGSGRLAGYLVAGGEPFRFLESGSGRTVLLVAGPWEEDLLPRVQKYRDDITGTSAERERLAVPERSKADAERRLREWEAQATDAGEKSAPQKAGK